MGVERVGRREKKKKICLFNKVFDPLSHISHLLSFSFFYPYFFSLIRSRTLELLPPPPTFFYFYFREGGFEGLGLKALVYLFVHTVYHILHSQRTYEATSCSVLDSQSTSSIGALF